MLSALEMLFLEPVKKACPDEIFVRTGPSLGPERAGIEVVEISACRLAVVSTPGEEPTDTRRPAFFRGVHRFDVAPGARELTLPDAAQGELVEVEFSAGRPAKRGDDYQVEGRTLRCFQPPTGGIVVVRLRGAPARGYEEWRRCMIDLRVRVFAGSITRADELSKMCLAAVLAAAAELGNVDLLSPAEEAQTAVSVRLVRSVTTMAGVTRAVVEAREAVFFRTDIDLVIRGDLEQVVAIGEKEPEGVIRAVLPAERT